MLTFKEAKGLYEICSDEKVIFQFNANEKIISVGKGKADYKMSRGSFRFKEKIENKIDLFLGKLSKNNGEINLELNNKNGEQLFFLIISVLDDRVKFHFEPFKNNDYNRLWFRLPAKPDEHIYGTGETFTVFDLRGEKVRIWVAEHSNAARIAKKIIKEKLRGKKPKKMLKFSKYETYYSQPTFVSSRKYFLHIDSNAYMDFDFSHIDYHEFMIRGLGDIYIGVADNFEGIMKNLTNLLGRQPKLPDWVYDGAILGIQGGTEIVKEKLEKAAKHNMKVAGVWCQDWEGARITFVGKQLMWNWEWDKEWYKDLDKELPKLKAQGIHFLGYCNPFLATEKDLYKYASSKGYCVKDKDGKDYLVKITTFSAAMVDLTNPDAYEWIKKVIKENMIGFGLDGWMADFGEYLPTDSVLFSGENAEIVHNTWPALWAKANREAVEECGKLGEVFFFTRAGHTNSVKYSTLMWTGDQHVDWSYDEGLPSVIPATLSLAVCGFGLAHSDVGGYATFSHMRREQELLMRWSEMSTFSPLFRSHEGNRPDDNVQFDANEELLDHYSKMSRIHFALAPYLKAADTCNSENGIPVMRPLFFYYHDKADFSEMYEYLLGRDLLVAPVIEKGAANRNVYFPDDTWIHLWTGKEYRNGCISVEAPLGKPPVFCRKDSEYLNEFLRLADII